ncbi:MAG: hypothetical protein GEU28_03530 [Dehalococcoidia bacterium]|nr:hypothetical protein [Dehalococcoidia bacterium]
MAFHPVDVRKVNFTPGMTVGDWFFTAGQVSFIDYTKGEFKTSPPGLPHYWSDIEVQTEHTMELLKAQLDGNGYELGDVVQATILLTNARRDFRGFDRVWRRIFEGVGTMPAINLVPSNQENGKGGVMVDELFIEIDLIMKHRS